MTDVLDAVIQERKYCRGCTRFLARSAFSRNRTRKDGLQGQCRECSGIAQATRGRKDGRREEVWRQLPRAELLRDRAELREGDCRLVRCRLPRSEPSALATRIPCAALVFRRRLAEHLLDLHGIENADDVEACFEELAVEAS